MKHRHDEVEYRHQVDLPGRGRREHETEFISQIPDLTYAQKLRLLDMFRIETSEDIDPISQLRQSTGIFVEANQVLVQNERTLLLMQR